MNIRVAGKLDLPQIVDIYNQAVLLRWATADLTPVTIASQRQWFREHDPKTWPIWVAEENGAIFGWSSLSAYRSGRMALRYTAEMSYYVDETQRRKGIASALIQYTIDQCSELKIKNLFSLLLERNMPSIRILEKFGFDKWGHMPDVAEVDGTTCGHLIYGRKV
ncbi:MAG: N-acetyltransferase family protein [Proteobacteria bacterium]|nr:MAG: N-acetyltransferase family protein [Pseudomonadota bacterium]